MKNQTRQTMFNKAYRGVIKQEGPSFNRNSFSNNLGCAYLSPTGERCGVGHILSKRHIDETFNHKAVVSAFYSRTNPSRKDKAANAALLKALKDSGVDTNDEATRCLLIDIQAAHDIGSQPLMDIHDKKGKLNKLAKTKFLKGFRHTMTMIAARHNLTVPEG